MRFFLRDVLLDLKGRGKTIVLSSLDTRVRPDRFDDYRRLTGWDGFA